MTLGTSDLSIVMPAKNEAEALRELLPKLRQTFADAEIIVVNDGSTDDTSAVCEEAGVRVISHPYSMGNGASIKSGARAASREIIGFMDADGQHDPTDLQRLISTVRSGTDLVVGARDWQSQAGVARGLANGLYNRLASMLTGHAVRDLTSGMRAARTEKFREFLPLLPNGFSYPTTSTMAFFRAGYSVGYEPIQASSRIGSSHINPVSDGIRFLLIIFRIATLYSPLKLFFPLSVLFFLMATFYSAYTLASLGRFTNMSALLAITSMLVFLIGLVSEQITTLLYTTLRHEHGNPPRNNGSSG